MKVLLIFIITTVYGYLQLAIRRYPQQSDKPLPWQKNNCPTQKLSDQYSQICYHKDIAYSIELINNKQTYHMAIDFTSPLSWIKGPECQLENNNNNSCTRISNSLKSEIRQQIRKVTKKIKQEFSKSKPASNLLTQDIITVGSIDKVTGILEKGYDIQFWTKDSGKLTSFYKLILIGLFLSGESQKISLKHTKFINATKISNHLNKLTDGAISVRFDQESENSFLNQIFSFVGSKQKVITIYLGSNSTITIGDLSVKNAKEGFSSIQWIKIDQRKYPYIKQITVGIPDDEQINQIDTNVEGVFTLSASYIGIPQKILITLLNKLDKVGKCKIGQNQFVQCNFKNKNFEQQRVITFDLEGISLSFSLGQLIRTKKGKNAVLNLRKSQTDTYMILGQPIFKKYFVVLDYSKNRIGVSERKKTLGEVLFSVITLVRFISVTFMIGCTILICYKPCKEMIKSIKFYRKINELSKSPESRKLKYSSVQQNPYQDVKGKVQEVLSSKEQQPE